jgi:hypothetical protein
MAKVLELLVQNIKCGSFPKEFNKWTSENKEIVVEYNADDLLIINSHNHFC